MPKDPLLTFFLPATCGSSFTFAGDVCRRLLGAETGPDSSSGAQLQQRLGRLVCGRVLASLPAVLNRARMLAPREQVHVQFLRFSQAPVLSSASGLLR